MDPIKRSQEKLEARAFEEVFGCCCGGWVCSG